jgi:hypothetical protein
LREKVGTYELSEDDRPQSREVLMSNTTEEHSETKVDLSVYHIPDA